MLNARPATRVLVLYAVGTQADDTEWTGPLYAQLVQNLLGHFEVSTTVKSLGAYRRGDLDRHDLTIYLGVVYDDPLPGDFRKDALATSKTLLWVDFNLWQIAWSGDADEQADNPAFVRRFGIRFLEMDGSGYPEIRYRGRQFRKNQNDPTLGRVSIVDPAKAHEVAVAVRPPNYAIPYITQAANLWYVSDNPFDDVIACDRYFAFADALHDVLGISHPESHRAIVRIEDVHPLASTARLRAIGELCESLKVPFCVSVIPEYRDPLGSNNNGVGRVVKMTDVPEFIAALRYLEQCGGQLLMHGYTHQLDEIPNPLNGVTAEDAEFYRKTSDTDDGLPVPGDSAKWARGRVNAGLSLFRRSRLIPVGWNTPHYVASVTDYLQFARMFRLFVDRGQYYSADSAGNLHTMDQAAPYVLTDIYGCLRVPETLGYIHQNPGAGEPTANMPEDIARSAAAYMGVRDGWAGFFYHWYLDPDYLREAVLKIKALGYEFVPPTSVKSARNSNNFTGLHSRNQKAEGRNDAHNRRRF
ncbi:MAG TPA: DUF2334 domain-containing protein [Acidobacteriota bacterium]|nr:DUF2334 domain-containing protein [Acidobacteriota bacterium]